MSTTKKVSKNFASLTIAEGVTRTCAILLFIYIARVLGVTSLGELAFATSVISFFTFFADFGLTTLGIREIARHKKETDSYGTNILLFQVLFTLLLIILLGVLLLFVPISYTLKVITFFYGLGLIPLALDMSYIFQAHEKMEYVLVGKTVNQGAYLILGLALITLFKNVVFVPIAALISGVGGAIIIYVILKKILNFKLKKPDTKIFKMLVIAAIPFVTSEILIQIYRNLDIVMLQFIKNTNEVGYYSSGYKIVNSIILIISFVPISFFPLISYHFKHDKRQFKQSILLFSQISGLLSIPLAVGGIIYARQILMLLYGSQLLAGTDAFKVLLLLLIVIPFKVLVASIIIAADKQNHYMVSGAIGTIINVILNIILIPRYGMIGAGIAIVVTETVAGIYLVFTCFKLFDYSSDILKKHFLKPTIAAIIMSLIAFKVPNIFLGIPLGALVYFAALYLIKGIPENQKIDDDFDPAILEQQPWFQADQLATASVEPATPTANPTDISLIDRSDSQSTVSREEVMPAPPALLEMLTRGDRFQPSGAISASPAQPRAEPIPSTSETREDESSTTPAISQQEEEPSFFFASDGKEADMGWPEWLKSLGAVTMEPEPEPVQPAPPIPPTVPLSQSEPGQPWWANLSDQVSAPEMPAHPAVEPVAAPGSNVSQESPVSATNRVETTPEQLSEPVADQEAPLMPTYRADALLENELETTMKRPAVRLQALQTSTAQSDPSYRLGRGRPADCTTTGNAADNLSSKARLVKGYQSQLAGAYDDAMPEYRIIIRNAPELLDEVISNLRALLKLAPKYSAGYRVLGDAYMRQGEYLQAMEAYNKAPTMARKAKSQNRVEGIAHDVNNRTG